MCRPCVLLSLFPFLLYVGAHQITHTRFCMVSVEQVRHHHRRQSQCPLRRTIPRLFPQSWAQDYSEGTSSYDHMRLYSNTGRCAFSCASRSGCLGFCPTFYCCSVFGVVHYALEGISIVPSLRHHLYSYCGSPCISHHSRWLLARRPRADQSRARSKTGCWRTNAIATPVSSLSAAV